MIATGFTVTGDPDKLPGCQVYKVALPVPVREDGEPAQTVDGNADADTFGNGLTVMEYPLEMVPNPQELFPFTVRIPFVAFEAKFIVIVFPLPFMVAPVPLYAQTYDVASVIVPTL